MGSLNQSLETTKSGPQEQEDLKQVTTGGGQGEGKTLE